MYEVVFTKKAESQLKKLSHDLQKRIISVLERVKIKPEKYFSRLVSEKAYKLRVGDYRVIADIFNDKLIILVLKVQHRRNIYKLK